VEALKVLETMQGPNSLIQKSVGLAGLMLEMGGATGKGEGRNMAYEILRSGKALAKLREIIEIQGGNPDVTVSDIPIGDKTAQIVAPANGYVVEFHNKRIVEIARLAGAPNDKGAGVLIHKKKGETVKKDEPILTIHAEKEWKLTNAVNSAKKNLPIIVEGMLLETVQDHSEI
jgi:AMP phosphorylase